METNFKNSKDCITTVVSMLPLPASFEPLINSRFTFTFPSEIGIESYLIQAVELPKWYDGKWQDMQLSLLDPITDSSTTKLFNFINKKQRPFICVISSLDPTGVEVERWNINVEKIKHIDFGNYDYSNSKPKEIITVLKIKSCTVEL